MKIIVDCNNDRIKIDSIEMICKQPRQTLKILEEILNRLNISGIKLSIIDEDREYCIEEW